MYLIFWNENDLLKHLLKMYFVYYKQIIEANKKPVRILKTFEDLKTWRLEDLKIAEDW